MKTLISHLYRSLPAFFVVLLSMFAATAQTTPFTSQDNLHNNYQTALSDSQFTWYERASGADPHPAPPSPNILNSTSLQAGAVSFHINGSGTAGIFNARTQFNIDDVRVLSVAGNSNIFVGANAGTTNTGSSNSFVGGGAGASNTGSLNSFVGFQTGYVNTGSENTFVGYQAGHHNTGSNNSFLGVRAGSNTTGSFNSFFGYNAGLSNLKGNSNSFVGFKAGQGNTNGTFNSSIGYNAGSNNKEGSNNTFIGANANNVSSSDLNYATAIGAGATVSTNNTIVLGRRDVLGAAPLGPDIVLIPGKLQLSTLPPGSGAALCRNTTAPTTPASPILNQIVNCSASSLRYKTNVTVFSSGLSLLQLLRPIRFEWKEGGMKDVGFGAEDVAAIEPLLATYNDKGEVEGVKYDRIATVLVNAVKEQQAQIEAQQGQLKEQQTQLKQQQAVIDGLKKLLCGQNPEAEVCKK